MGNGFYQVISRNNDRNGNPYRLVMVYNHNASLIRAIEERSSSPNCLRDLHRQGIYGIYPFHVQPLEYRTIAAMLKTQGVLEYQ